MPIATPAQYAAMLDAAQKGGYAYPAINVTSLPTINGALKAFSEAKSDGIIQVSTGGGEFASGTGHYIRIRFHRTVVLGFDKMAGKSRLF